jgi:hypothetical protein
MSPPVSASSPPAGSVTIIASSGTGDQRRAR